MSPLRALVLMAVVASSGSAQDAAAYDLPGGVKIQSFVRPSKSSTTKDRSALYVPKTPDFSLSVGAGKVVPALTGKGIPAVVTGFLLPDGQIHSPNERLFADYVPLGIATARELFRVLATL